MGGKNQIVGTAMNRIKKRAGIARHAAAAFVVFAVPLVATAADPFTFSVYEVGVPTTKVVSLTNNGWMYVTNWDNSFRLLTNGVQTQTIPYGRVFGISASDNANGLWIAGYKYGSSAHEGHRLNTATNTEDMFNPGWMAATSHPTLINGKGEMGACHFVTQTIYPHLNWGLATIVYRDTAAGIQSTEYGPGGKGPLYDVRYQPPEFPARFTNNGVFGLSLKEGGDTNWTHAVTIHNGVQTDFGRGILVDVNDSGQVLYQNVGFPSWAKFYDPQTGTTVQLDPYIRHQATAMNRWGQVVGAILEIGSGYQLKPFVWQHGRFVDLTAWISAAGFAGFHATAINDRGQIAGYGWRSDPNKTYAALLTPNTGTSSFFPTTGDANANSLSVLFSDAPSENWYSLRTAERPVASAPDDGGVVIAAAPPALSPPARPTGFAYRARDMGRFAVVNDFPEGFATPFTVSVDGTVLGTFKPGDILYFADYVTQLGDRLIGGTVDHFDVTGITDLPATQFRDIMAPDFALNLIFADSAGNTGNGTFSIHARNTVLADLDGDGHVSYADFFILEQKYGQTDVSWFDGDLDFDGCVTPADFFALKGRFDAPLSLSEAEAVFAFETFIPEPGNLLLLALAGFGLVRPRRVPATR